MQRQNEQSLRRSAARRRLVVVVVVQFMLLSACSKPETASSPPEAEPAVTVAGHAPTAEARGGAAEEKTKEAQAIERTKNGAETARAARSPASTDIYAESRYEVYSEKETAAMPTRPKPAPAAPPTAANGGREKSEKAAAQTGGFPWPPPQPSSERVLPVSLLVAALRIANASELAASGKTLRDLNGVLTDALDRVGYTDRSYFTVPDGYALVTRIESIEPDGTPKAGAERWNLTSPGIASFSLSDYLKALFSAKPGLYRVIVFVITSRPFRATGKPPTAGETEDWLSRGYNVLPPDVGVLRYTDEVACTALIYEFEKAPAGTAQIRRPGQVTAQQHLERSHLLSALGG